MTGSVEHDCLLSTQDMTDRSAIVIEAIVAAQEYSPSQHTHDAFYGPWHLMRVQRREDRSIEWLQSVFMVAIFQVRKAVAGCAEFEDRPDLPVQSGAHHHSARQPLAAINVLYRST